MKTKLSFIALGFYILLILTLVGFPLRAVASQDTPPEAEVLTPLRSEVVNPYFTVETYALADGSLIEKDIISGPPQPPLGFEAEREASIVTLTSRSTLANFPSYSWVFGCSAVAGAMIAGFYDRTGYPNMYSGPTNGSIMPLSDTMWGEKWPDCCVSGYYYARNPLVASMQGLDGRTSRGSIENYWYSINSTADDPYITNGWSQHTWGEAIGDYMKTSQSAYGSRDGGTWFWNYGDANKLSCSAMETMGVSGETYKVSQADGTYGRKLFYQARGYTVTDCYNQKTDNQFSGGFSLADFQAQIDAGHPVLLNLVGHSIVGFGYEGSKIYIRDTWCSDPETVYSMTWGGSYQDMPLHSVSIVNLEAPGTPPPNAPTGVAASDGDFTDRVNVSWPAPSGATYYKVYRNTSNTHTLEAELTSSHPASPYDDTLAIQGELYYYWVIACNSEGCSDYSAVNTGYADLDPPTGLTASDGTFSDKVELAWNPSAKSDYYELYRNVNETHTSEALLTSGTSTAYDDTSATPGQIHYYWVKACSDATGCSVYSTYATGLRAETIPPAPTGLTASNGTYIDKVVLNWNPAAGASHYKVFRNIGESHVGETELASSHPTTTYNDTTAAPGEFFTYWVQACNSAGCSDYCTCVSGSLADGYAIFLPLINK